MPPLIRRHPQIDTTPINGVKEKSGFEYEEIRNNNYVYLLGNIYIYIISQPQK